MDRRQALTSEFNFRGRAMKEAQDYVKAYRDELRRAEKGERPASAEDLDEMRAGVKRGEEIIAAEVKALARVEAERDALNRKPRSAA